MGRVHLKSDLFLQVFFDDPPLPYEFDNFGRIWLDLGQILASQYQMVGVIIELLSGMGSRLHRCQLSALGD